MIERLLPALFAATLPGQDFTQRGFLESRAVVFPQAAPGDSGRVVGDSLLRYEASYKFNSSLQFAGAFDARTDSHHQTARRWDLSWQDRTVQRPAFAVRRLSATYSRGAFTGHLGKQFIRWGKTDILNPTDRFAPRDYLSILDNDFLAVTAARVNIDSAGHTVDAVFVPRFTPSRIPLLGQRWAPLPENLPPGIELRDGGARFPGGPQFGLRWSRLGQVETSLCYYEGFNHLPLLDTTLASLAPLRADVRRVYPKLRMYGGDLVTPLPWFTIKAEAAWFTTTSALADEYVLYVVQLERLIGEWVFVGGYAGEAVTERRSTFEFAPDRGLTRAFLGRAGYTIDANRGIAVESAVRQSGDGVWVRFEYSQTFGQHWRATTGFTWIHGNPGDFLGAFRRNSHTTLALRYSF